MLKINTLCVMLLVLVGCGDVSVNECDIEKSYTVEQTDDTGITLLPSNRMFITFAEVSKIYQDVQACMGLTAEPPTVQFTSFNEFFLGGLPDEGLGGGAVYIVPNKRIIVNTDYSEIFKQTCQSDREYLSHEYVHHIMSLNNLKDASNDHRFGVFRNCIIKNLTD